MLMLTLGSTGFNADTIQSEVEARECHPIQRTKDSGLFSCLEFTDSHRLRFMLLRSCVNF